VKVLLAARDIRVRRALSRLLELHGDRIVGVTSAPHLLPDLDAELCPDLVLLELGRREDPRDLRVVERLAHRGRAVIAVCSGSTSPAAVLAAGAQACLEKDADFADRLATAIRAVSKPGLSTPPV
jgi:DNA-binding NarL/FixJ family response regulator